MQIKRMLRPLSSVFCLTNFAPTSAFYAIGSKFSSGFHRAIPTKTRCRPDENPMKCRNSAGIGRVMLCCIAVVSMFSLSAQTPRKDSGADGLNSIKPLQIGDTIPEALWKMPLVVINHPDGKETISLSDYKDKKLLILDFWSTWCGSCIAAMPRFHILNDTFEADLEILPINRQSKRHIETFSRGNKILDSLRLYSVTDAEAVSLFFPHKMVPHEVWIKDNIVQGITYARDVNEETIKKILETGVLKTTSKIDQLDFDSNKAFLIDNNGGSDSTFKYRSIFTPFKKGIPSRTSIVIGANREKWRISATNMGILGLFGLAFPQLNRLPQEQLIINLPKDKLKKQKDDGVSIDAWNAKNLYCYELNVPPMDNEQWRKMIRQDLERYLAIMGRIEYRNGVEYFVLEQVERKYNTIK
ncbi:peroxiredoxin family protein [Sphingobacterium sp. HSC-15S19]|uniref:peroxiredoxin family protein n=1 Tax=Sphingobacterium sp. HSC-15S19 TaxID=2910971 RepID=UPI003D24873C